VNDAPIASPDSVGPATEDVPLNVAAAQLLANDIPGPANELGQAMTITAVAATANTHGTVSLAGGVITYTPDPNYSGPASFTYTMSDAGTTNGVADPRTASTTANLSVTPTGPKVTGVFVSGSAWRPSFLSYLSDRGLGDATYGYRIAGAAPAPQRVPWTGVDTLSVRFDSDVSVPAGAAALRSALTGSDYAPALGGNTYDALTRTLRVRLSRPVTSDRVELRLAGDVGGIFRTGPGVDNARLDGESTGVFPSGNGTPGGDFAFRIDILPGDADRDGRVTALDLTGVRQRLFRTTADVATGSRAYSPFHDLDGTGGINSADYFLARSTLFTSLPTSLAAADRLFGARRSDLGLRAGLPGI
jgi:hypothetical protein